MSIVENNNSLTQFMQTWPEYVFTDSIPEEPPELNADETLQASNPDGTLYSYQVFQHESENETRDLLLHLSNFQLAKEFRQRKDWKLEYKGDEEFLRKIIVPGTTISRSYTPSFSNGKFTLPYTSVNPEYNLKDCRITVGLDFEKLYFTGWLYIGDTLKETLDKISTPFPTNIWLLKDPETGDLTRFEITDSRVYNLPGDKFTGKENTIVTSNIFNQVINTLGKLDEGEYW